MATPPDELQAEMDHGYLALGCISTNQAFMFVGYTFFVNSNPSCVRGFLEVIRPVLNDPKYRKTYLTLGPPDVSMGTYGKEFTTEVVKQTLETIAQEGYPKPLVKYCRPDQKLTFHLIPAQYKAKYDFTAIPPD